MDNISDLAAARREKDAIWRKEHPDFPRMTSFHFDPAPVTQLQTRRETARDRIGISDSRTVNDFSAPDCEPYTMDDWDKMVSRDFGFDILLDGEPVNDEGFTALGYWDPEEDCWLDGSCPGWSEFSSPVIPRPLMCLLSQRLPALTEQEILDEISVKISEFFFDNSPG